jgi:transposase
VSSRRPYATDLTDEEWWILKPLVPQAKPGGRPRTHKTRELLDAIFYALRAGCAWRLLPHEFPPWQTVYHYFRLWRIDGTSGSGSTALCASASARWQAAKRLPARRSWTASRRGPRRRAALAATMGPRR